MFILPPTCIVPSATSLTMSPVFPSFLYFISHTPSAVNETSDTGSRICPNSDRGLETAPALCIGCTSSILRRLTVLGFRLLQRRRIFQLAIQRIREWVEIRLALHLRLPRLHFIFAFRLS